MVREREGRKKVVRCRLEQRNVVIKQGARKQGKEEGTEGCKDGRC